MSRMIEDGNVVGRVGALLALAAVALLVAKVCGGNILCPLPGLNCCSAAASQSQNPPSKR